MDPPARDSAHPAQMAELAFESAGERLNGLFYLPAGSGPHPVVVLLHGNPGNERNLDVAQALRRAGYATLYFNYRGSWGSGGMFSRMHAIEDVHAALRFVRSPLAEEQYRVDGGGPALVAEVKANAERWDVLAYAPALRERRVLLVGSANRSEHDGLLMALGGPRTPNVTAHWWPTDHSFSDRRIALARAILDWVRGPCGL
jgi:pimeloyl-ACP methyl ester carboxylesterase